MTETYSLSTNFGGNINTSTLHTEIEADGGISTTLIGVNLDADVVSVVFQSTISGGEKTALDAVVSAHISTVWAGTTFTACDVAGGLDINGGFASVVWDTVSKMDNIYSHTISTSEITFNCGGDYTIYYSIGIDILSGNGNALTVARLVKDSGSGYIEITGSRSFSYQLNICDGNSIMGTTFDLYSIVAGDKIKVEVMKNFGSKTLRLKPNISRIQIKKID